MELMIIFKPCFYGKNHPFNKDLRFPRRPSCSTLRFCQLYLNLRFQILSFSPIFWINKRSSSLKGIKFLYFFNYFNWLELKIIDSLGDYIYPFLANIELHYILLFFVFIWFSNSLIVSDLLGRIYTMLFFGLDCFLVKTVESSSPLIYRYV
jgi:hypothetical protein